MKIRHRPGPLLLLALTLLVGLLIPRSLDAVETAKAKSGESAKNDQKATRKNASSKATKDRTALLDPDPNHLSAVEALEQIRRAEEESVEGSGFTYRPGNRRDPFMSPQDILKAQMSGRTCAGDGMECWLIQDVTVIGVLQRNAGNVALVIGPDGYGTTLHEGDRLYDGVVRRIDSRGGLVVFRQSVDDPARIKPYRDVEKGLNLHKEGRS
ncbi:MAG: hypothetical protein ACE5HU_07950 [Acidobacteriota bacterium]